MTVHEVNHMTHHLAHHHWGLLNAVGHELGAFLHFGVTATLTALLNTLGRM